MPEVASLTRSSAATRPWRDFRASLKAQGREDLTPYLDTNPLYASLEVKLADPAAVGVVDPGAPR